MSSAWRLAKLSEVCSKISDGTHHSPDVQFKEPGEGRFKYITSKNIRPWGLDLNEIAYVDGITHRQIYSRCNPELEDVLLTKDGANTGNVAINTLDEEFSLLSSVAVLKPKREVIEPRFLRYFIESPVGSKRLVGEMTGTAIRRIILKKIKETEIPIAPLVEQRRIVAEIEKQFTRLDAGVAALRRVQANLKRYRAAVLKAACEGRLVPTEAELAKAESRTYETGEQLLVRILADRRKNWQGRGKYKEPATPDTTNFPLLPGGWAVASVDQLCGHITSGSRDWSKFYGKGDGTFILAQNVRSMRLDLTERQSVDAPKNDTETERTRVKLDDVLVTIVGAKTGDVCRVPSGLDEHFVCQSVALLRPLVSGTAKFVEIYLASKENGQEQWKRYMYGQGRPHLSFEQLRMTTIQLPPLAEQTRIVSEVERRLSVIEELEAAVATNLQRAIYLRQSVLRRSFSYFGNE